MSNKTVIKLDNISKIYKVYPTKINRFLEVMFFIKNKHEEFNALSNITFELNKGEILGIIGSNGAGKSTLLKVITGVTKPTSGKLSVKGKVASLLELGAAFNFELTGVQNIYQQGQILGMTKEQIDSKVEDIVEFSGINKNVNQLVKTYSSGMFARLAFSCAINMDFDVLIVDEILSVGDTNFQNKCINRMQELTKEGKTILFVSHDLHAVKYFCNRVIRLDKGRIIDEGDNVLEIVEKYERNIMPERVDNEKKEVKERAFSTNEIITIDKVILKDGAGNRTKKFKHKENIKVQINYTLHKYEEGMFFGVGFRNSNNDYINGMNTKQEGLEIQQKPGEYTLELEYICPMVYKDIYSLWGVCYNSSGTVVLSDYIIKDAFEVYVDKDVCEGVTYIEHNWQYK
ncbi:MAG: ABC transporter ATP-binding protein [Clostridia bacterium]